MTENAAVNTSSATPSPARVLIWDAPVRVCHWLIVASLLGCWVSAGRWEDAHVAFEIVAAALVAFRLAWGFHAKGFAGTRWLLHKPRAIWKSLCLLASRRGELYPVDPIRGALHLLLLVGVPLIGITGVMEEAFPLARWIGPAHLASYVFVFVAVAGHVALVLYASWVYRENLVRCMVSGMYVAPRHEGLEAARWPVAVAVAIATTALWAWLAFGA